VLPEAFCGTLLWRDIEKTGKRMAGCKICKQTLSFFIRRVSVDGTGLNVGNPQGVYLISLERESQQSRSIISCI
jgi:hypothetical protein